MFEANCFHSGGSLSKQYKKRQPRHIFKRVFGAVVTLGVAAALFAAPQESVAHAVNNDLDLPTWNDVEAAKKDTAKGKKKIAEIEALITEVEQRVEDARVRSEDASAKAVEAEEAFMHAHEKAEELQKQAAESQKEAEAAAEQAAALVSQMYRSGGIDRNVELFFETDGDTADELLDRLAMMSKATERNTTISQEAEIAMNNAKSLGEQAEDAQNERERLSNIAEQEAAEAAAAVETERQNLAEQEEQEKVLKTQLAALKDTETKTVKGYQERLRKEEEARIAREKAAAEAARKAAEEAAKNQNAGGGGGGGGGGSTGGGGGSGGGGGGGGGSQVGTGGWVRPLNAGSYWVSTEFLGYPGHMGIDMASNAGNPIYAAASGTVILSGWWSGCGNAVRVAHAGGVVTSYCHMISSPVVGHGQYVSAGQIIGYVGSTGFSTGNHLHFETMVGGYYNNPRPFMNARGIWL